MCDGWIRRAMVALAACVRLATANGQEPPLPAGLELRFDAAIFSARQPGAAVANWRDSSGHERHATGGSGGAIYGQARTPAGLYAVSFHGFCEEAMSFCHNPNGRDLTVIGVSRSRIEATEWPYYFKSFIGWREVAGETPLAVGSFNITQTAIALSGYGEAGLSYVMYATHAPVRDFTVNTVRLNSDTGVLDVFRDMQPLGELSGIADPIQGAAPCGQLGGISTCGGLGWAGDLAEVLVYSRALTDEERQAVESYLHDKWLLALKAYEPNPGDGAVDVLASVPTWRPGHTAVRHELYLGTTPDLGPGQLVFSGTLWPPIDFVPPDWKPLTTYFWRVDEVEADATVHTGDVWRFVTAPSTAHTPHPRDGARFVDPETFPYCQPGLHTSEHDVYFGASRQDVVDGTGGTFRGRVEASTFDPGPLEPETTYYWRMDEVALDGQTHPGPVWSFTTLGPGGGLKGEYFNNLSRYGLPALTRVDASIDFAWGEGSPAPAVDADYFSARWTGDLEPVFSDTYTFTVRTNGYVALWVGDDKLIDRQILTPAPVEDKATMALTAGRTYPIRVEYEVGRGQAAIQLFWQSSDEPRQIIPTGFLQPPVRARGPAPADAAVETAHDMTLRWSPGWKAAQHDVYFGLDADEVAAATTAGGAIYLGRLPAHVTSFHTGVLDWGQDHYWRVDEVNDTEAKSPWRGNLWRFTTADFIPVDDFESYSDQDGRRIYETWTDGWINGTGSTVGYVIAGSWPIRVRRGAQSMPFDYNNLDPPYFSEAQRSWSTPQDWSVHGASELSLWFAGAPVSFRETGDGGVLLSGAGGPMECTYDPYRFAYRILDGDGQIVARVDSLTNAAGWARAGVMIADTPDAGSQYAILGVVAEHGLLFGNCPYDSTAGQLHLRPGVSAPHWVRLTRTGNRLTAEDSPDGVNWQDVAEPNGAPLVITMDLPQRLYLGVCVTSDDVDTVTTAGFSEIAFTGSVSDAWQVSDTGWEQPGNSRGDFYVALTDAAGHRAVAVHPDPDAVTTPDWTQWTISLSVFRDAGVDLTSIRRMFLGVGDRVHPQAGGAGMIYIDDIRINAP